MEVNTNDEERQHSRALSNFLPAARKRKEDQWYFVLPSIELVTNYDAEAVLKNTKDENHNPLYGLKNEINIAFFRIMSPYGILTRKRPAPCKNTSSVLLCLFL